MKLLTQGALIHLIAVCHDCRRRHEIQATPADWLIRMSDWEVKHRGHRLEYRSPRRQLLQGLKDRWVYPMLDRFGVVPWWLAYAPNTDFLLGYAASAAFTIDLSSLASSATFVAGRESTAVSNTTNKYLDYLIGGKITTGTTPTANKTIRVYAYGSVDDTPTYPDVLDGTDSAETITNAKILDQFPFLAAMDVTTASDIAHWLTGRSLANAFGGVVPKNFGLFVAHDTAVNLHATAGNHVLSHTGVYIVG